MNTPTLAITLIPAGNGGAFRVTVSGPLRDKLLCMKMIAQAIILVEEYQEPTILVKAQLPRNMG